MVSDGEADPQRRGSRLSSTAGLFEFEVENDRGQQQRPSPSPSPPPPPPPPPQRATQPSTRPPQAPLSPPRPSDGGAPISAQAPQAPPDSVLESDGRPCLSDVEEEDISTPRPPSMPGYSRSDRFHSTTFIDPFAAQSQRAIRLAIPASRVSYDPLSGPSSITPSSRPDRLPHRQQESLGTLTLEDLGPALETRSEVNPTSATSWSSSLSADSTDFRSAPPVGTSAAFHKPNPFSNHSGKIAAAPQPPADRAANSVPVHAGQILGSAPSSSASIAVPHSLLSAKSKRMSFDSTPSFSSPLAFAAIFANDEDNVDDKDAASHRHSDTDEDKHDADATDKMNPDELNHRAALKAPMADLLSRSSSTSAYSVVGGRRREPSGSGRALRPPGQRMEKDRSGSISLYKAATGASSRLGMATHTRQASLQDDDDTASTSSDGLFSAPNSSLTRKSSLASSTGSMGPPAVPRRAAEWWEADKGLWNFNDDEEHDVEPIRFILSGLHGDHEGVEAKAPAQLWGRTASNSPTRHRSVSGHDREPSSGHASTTSAGHSPALGPEAVESTTSSIHDLFSSPAIEAEDGDTTIVDRDAAAERVATSPSTGEQNDKSLSVNVLMELSLENQMFMYLSPAWTSVIGSDPVELYDVPIAELLAPGDVNVFAEASDQLQANESHTVEAIFRLRVERSALAAAPDASVSSEDGSEGDDEIRYYQEMEGKGMLVHDRHNGLPSHSMWVFKATGPPEPEADLPELVGLKSGRATAAFLDDPTATEAHVASISVEPVLCRICERDIPAWFFEKHSEICNEVHRLEMEIGECNETLHELRRTIKAIVKRLEEAHDQPCDPPAEYRGIQLTTPPASTQPPSALEGINRSVLPRQPNAASVRKTHMRALDAALEILQTALEISTPATREEQADEPIEKQRLLSPTSENKVVTVKQWRRSPGEDAAIDAILADVEASMRSKLSAVNRMLNTIVYVETVRQEWEVSLEAALAAVAEAEAEAEEQEEASRDGGSLRGSSGDESEDAHESIRSSMEPGTEASGGPRRGQMGVAIQAEAGAEAAVETETLTVPTPVSSSSAKPFGPHTMLKQKSDAGRPSSQARIALHSKGASADSRNSTGNEEEDDDVLLTSGLLLERDDREVPPLPRSSMLIATGPAATEEEDEIPAVESQMGGSSRLAPIPIPLGGAHSATPISTSARRLESPQVAEVAELSQPRERRSASRSRRASHLPGPNDNSLLQTPPLSPRYPMSEPLSMSVRSGRKPSISHRSPRSMAGSMPLSPRLPPTAPSSKPTASSIKDFDIIKPISKGAFGSVFLAKKRTTGDYYAIKVLKKSDMIAKNQITNVKAERMILMTQNQSPFVVKLFFTFQSADYLYLVMEYLPGGDCASLCKILGGLPEEWAQQYIAEIVVGLEHLHSKGVVHRDLKPDNVLIDQKGHLKLTDFGLSKIGLLGRQSRPEGLGGATGAESPSGGAQGARTDTFVVGSLPSSSASAGSSSRHASVSTPAGTTAGDSAASFSPTTPGIAGNVRDQTFFAAHQRGRIVSSSTDVSDSSETEGYQSGPRPLPSAKIDSPGAAFGSHPLLNSATSPSQQPKGFVGTPDYLAPESILGVGMDDFAVDFWALGVILYELLYGFPPFHADNPEKVFDNILSRRIDWEEEAMEVSPEARSLMEALMCTDPKTRLGSQGVDQIKRHPFFEGIDWDNVTADEGPFVPQVTDPESTDYFDLRGAVHQEFDEEHPQNAQEFAKAIEGKRMFETGRPPSSRIRSRFDKVQLADRSQTDDFGNFSYKNLPVLKQANDEVIRKMREDQMPALAQTLEQPIHHARHRSFSARGKPTVRAQLQAVGCPPSPSQSISSQGSTPSRSTAPTSPAGLLQHPPHARRPSELVGLFTSSPPASPAVPPAAAAAIAVKDRKRSHLVQTDSPGRRNSMPTRLRTRSAGVSERPSIPPHWYEAGKPGFGAGAGGPTTATVSHSATHSPTSTTGPAISPAAHPAASAWDAARDKDVIECLVAEDNPIALRMLENILTKLGCRCTAVRNGAEAVRLAMADARFDVLFIDVTLPIVNGQDVARMVKSTRNANSLTPIVALAFFDRGEPIDAVGSVFDAVLAKPLERNDVCGILASLGFTALQVANHSASASAATSAGSDLATGAAPFAGGKSRSVSSSSSGGSPESSRRPSHAAASGERKERTSPLGKLSGPAVLPSTVFATPFSSSLLGSRALSRSTQDGRRNDGEANALADDKARPARPPPKPTEAAEGGSFVAASAALNKAVSNLSLD